MKKIKIFGLLAGLSVLVLLAGCKKDMVTRMNAIPITFERFNGDGKAYVDGLYACWEAGDAIRITSNATSNYDGSISITYPGGVPIASATAGGFTTATDDSVYVAYPQGLFADKTIGNNMTLSLPNEYLYVTTNGKQKIECPMVGRLKIKSYESGGENPNVLKLTNLCCLLRIQLNKPSEGAFVLDTLQVVNKTKSTPMTPMSGSGTVTFVTSGTDTIPVLNMTGEASENDTVTLNLHSNAVAINETEYFYIPIPPQAGGQRFTIRIHNQLSGTWQEKDIYSNMAIPGNSVATLAGPTTDDNTVPFTFYDWIQNNAASTNCLINLGAYVSATTKMEMTFVPTHIDGSQYYSGSRAGTSGTIFFAIAGSSNNRYFVDGFMGYNLHTAGSSYSGSDNSTSGVMERVQGVKYRHSLEVRSAGGDNYYGFATFERLDNNTIVTGSTDTSGLLAGYNSNPIYVFGYGGNLCPGMKLYRYRVWSNYANNELSHNFVPAIKHCSGNVDSIGVYNMVTSHFIPCDKATTYGGTTGSYFTIGND